MRSLSPLVAAVLAALAVAAPASGAPAGSLDPGFNATGVRLDQLDLGAPPPFSFYDGVVVGADGRLQAVAATAAADGLNKVTVRGLTLSGEPDGAWAGGVSRFPVFTKTVPADIPYVLVRDAARTPDGRLVVVGFAGIENGTTMQDRAFVQRYRTDGTLDPDFGTNGTVVFSVSLGAREASFSSVAVDAAGRVVAVGQDRPYIGGGTTNALLVRFLPSGQLDTSLHGSGWVTSPDATAWYQVVLAPDGGYRVLGDGAAGPVLAKLGADGVRDVAYGPDGFAHVPQISTSANGLPKTLPSAFALLPDGRVVVAGLASWRQGVGTDFDVFESWLMRFTPAGVLDPAFDGDGVARWHFGEDGPGTWADSQLSDLAVQDNGDVVAVGHVGTSDGDHVHGDGLVIRVRPDGSLDPRFGTGGQVRLKLGAAGGNTFLARLALAPARRIVLAGGIADSATTLAAGLVRLVGDGDPTAALGAPAQVKAGTPVALDASASADDWQITSFGWDLNGDGLFGDASGPTASPVLPLGTHTVAVRVTDDAGQTGQVSAQVKVVVPFVVKLPKQLKLLGSSVKVPMTCTGTASCHGTLSLLLKAKTARVVTVRVGRSSFALRAGRRALVRVKVARRVRAAVRRRGKVTLTMAVRAKGVAETLQRSRLVVRR